MLHQQCKNTCNSSTQKQQLWTMQSGLTPDSGCHALDYTGCLRSADPHSVEGFRLWRPFGEKSWQKAAPQCKGTVCQIWLRKSQQSRRSRRTLKQTDRQTRLEACLTSAPLDPLQVVNYCVGIIIIVIIIIILCLQAKNPLWKTSFLLKSVGPGLLCAHSWKSGTAFEIQMATNMVAIVE